jgi:hypothetical protein
LIRIKPTSETDRRVWSTLLDLAEREEHWTLVGARMVQLHILERERRIHRESLDADALAEARIKPSAVGRISQILKKEGFELQEPSTFGLGHRFVRDDVEIDVLAPEHLGPRDATARVTIPPAHTVGVPGGRQALDRTERVEIDVSGRRGTLPRPNLLGAILLKARAVDVDDVPENQRTDLAVLLSFVEDPESMRRQLRGREAAWIRGRTEMDRAGAACWRGLDDDDRQRGLAALRILAGWTRDK